MGSGEASVGYPSLERQAPPCDSVNRRRDRQIQAVCRAQAWESPRTAMGGGGERFKAVLTVRVLQACGDSLRGSASLNFPFSWPHPSPAPESRGWYLPRYHQTEREGMWMSFPGSLPWLAWQRRKCTPPPQASTPRALWAGGLS